MHRTLIRAIEDSLLASLLFHVAPDHSIAWDYHQSVMSLFQGLLLLLSVYLHPQMHLADDYWFKLLLLWCWLWSSDPPAIRTLRPHVLWGHSMSMHT